MELISRSHNNSQTNNSAVNINKNGQLKWIKYNGLKIELHNIKPILMEQASVSFGAYQAGTAWDFPSPSDYGHYHNRVIVDVHFVRRAYRNIHFLLYLVQQTNRIDAPKFGACTRGILLSPGRASLGILSQSARNEGKTRLSG